MGSVLIARKYREPMHRYYAFARNADDIANSSELPPEEKVARLDIMEEVLLGRRRERLAERDGVAGEPGDRPG